MANGLPRLRFATSCEVAAPRQGAGGGPVQVWRDAESRVVAWGHSEDGQHWMHWPRLASFRFAKAGEEITAFPASGAKTEIIRDTWLRSVVPMALQALGREALHASAVRGPSGVVAFCARSQTGKSTLAFGLARRGYPQWADDAVVIDTADQQQPPSVLPLPFIVRLRPASAAFYRDAGSDRIETIPDSEPARLAAIFIIERRPEDASDNRSVEIERLKASRSFVALLAHAYCFNPADTARRATMVEQYLDLAARVPAFRLGIPDDLNVLPKVLDEVERAIATDFERSIKCAP